MNSGRIEEHGKEGRGRKGGRKKRTEKRTRKEELKREKTIMRIKRRDDEVIKKIKKENERKVKGGCEWE